MLFVVVVVVVSFIQCNFYVDFTFIFQLHLLLYFPIAQVKGKKQRKAKVKGRDVDSSPHSDDLQLDLAENE